MPSDKQSAPPMRLQLRRRKGFDLQKLSLQMNGRTAVNCARPGPHGNPFLINAHQDAEMVCFLHRQQIVAGLARWTVPAIKEKLRGKNLACFCPPDAKHCHVDFLLELANEDAEA